MKPFATPQREMPWRLGHLQRQIIDRLIALNDHFKAEERNRITLKPVKIDWRRGGGCITAMQVAEMFNFDYYSEAERLLRGLEGRGILSMLPQSYSWTLSQDALRKLGYIK